MPVLKLRLAPGAVSGYVLKLLNSKKITPKIRKYKSMRLANRSSLRKFSCPCGCGRNGWFSQPRSRTLGLANTLLV